MRKFFENRTSEILGIVAGLTLITFVLGHGCSEMKSTESGFASGGSSPLGTTDGSGAGSSIPAKPNAPTVSLVYNKQLLDNYVACSGIQRPSIKTIQEWEKRQSTFSEFGYPTDVTAPMLMALTAVVGEVCNDLVNLEINLPAANRRVFNSIDFSRGPANIDSVAVGDTVRRLARSCWGRNEEAAELEIIDAEFDLAMLAASAADTDAIKTRKMALWLCSGVFSSLSGITF